MVNFSLLILSKVTDSTCPAYSASGVRTLHCGLLGLCAHSCRAFSNSTIQDTLYTVTQAPRLLMLLLYSFFFAIFYTWSLTLFIQSHGLRTMGRSIKPTLHYKNKVGQPCDSIMTSRSAPINRGVFTKDLVKTWALSPNTCLGGIPCPTSPLGFKLFVLPCSHMCQGVENKGLRQEIWWCHAPNF